MKAYMVGIKDYDGTDILGVYSTKENAVQALDYLSPDLDEGNIFEFECDPPNNGEKYDKIYLCSIYTKDNVDEGMVSKKKSEVIPIDYGTCSTNGDFRSMGFGKTIEEARANAQKAKDQADLIWQIGENGEEARHAHPSKIYHWRNIDAGRCYAVHRDRNECIIAIDEYKKSGKLSPYLTVY